MGLLRSDAHRPSQGCPAWILLTVALPFVRPWGLSCRGRWRSRRHRGLTFGNTWRTLYDRTVRFVRPYDPHAVNASLRPMREPRPSAKGASRVRTTPRKR